MVQGLAHSDQSDHSDQTGLSEQGSLRQFSDFERIEKHPVFQNESRFFDTKLKSASQKFETQWKLQSVRQKMTENDLFETKVIFLINIGHKMYTTLEF